MMDYYVNPHNKAISTTKIFLCIRQLDIKHTKQANMYAYIYVRDLTKPWITFCMIMKLLFVKNVKMDFSRK